MSVNTATDTETDTDTDTKTDGHSVNVPKQQAPPTCYVAVHLLKLCSSPGLFHWPTCCTACATSATLEVVQQTISH